MYNISKQSLENILPSNNLESRDTQVNRYEVMQYFYIVVYTIVGDDMTMCKIGLNPHQIIEWGRREATRHPERTYKLFRQPITRTGTLSFYKQLPPFEPKVPSKDTFDCDAFETHKGADFDIDVTR